MSRERRVRVAVFTATAFFVCGFCVSPGRVWADDDDARVILFSGRDIWRNGIFAHGGMIYAPGGVDQDGVLFKVLLSGGLYRYNASGLGGERVIGAEGVIQVMPGWRVKRGDLEVKVFFGLDGEYHSLRPDDPSNPLRGRSFGVRFASEFWYEPTPATMVAGDASLASISTNHSVRAAYGWRVFDELFYLGPEIQYFGAYGYRQLRLGAHITSMKTGDIEWSAAGGWAEDSDGRSSPYLRLGVLKRQ
jgi:hypothetical protein